MIDLICELMRLGNMLRVRSIHLKRSAIAAFYKKCFKEERGLAFVYKIKGKSKANKIFAQIKSNYNGYVAILIDANLSGNYRARK